MEHHIEHTVTFKSSKDIITADALQILENYIKQIKNSQSILLKGYRKISTTSAIDITVQVHPSYKLVGNSSDAPDSISYKIMEILRKEKIIDFVDTYNIRSHLSGHEETNSEITLKFIVDTKWEIINNLISPE